VEEWKGFGLQKNSVIEKCQSEWILLIDADEEISEALSEEIKHVVSQKQSQFNVYKLRFLTLCFGKKIRHGGWSGFYRIRLFKNGSGKYNENQVHENFLTQETIGRISKDIYHYTYKDIEDYLVKFNQYTTHSARMYFERNKKKSAPMILLSAMFYFVKTYIFQLGILDGFEGYLLSKFGAMTILVKYAKLEELQKRRIDSH
jgi:glycosyltransferase involved in cell wall biosynthesis